MTVRLSEGLRNALANARGFAGALNFGYINFYTGSQPASADAAHGSTLLGTMSISGASLTKETVASATLTVTGGSGTLTGVTVGTAPIVVAPGLVTWLTSTTVTAALIATAINRSGLARATSSGDVVTVRPPPGMGTAWNGLALAAAGITCTGSNFASGVAPANGLYLDSPAAGVIAKPSGVVWSMTAVATGTIGWGRFYSSDTGDTGGAITTLTEPLYPRLDGSVGVGSGDFQLSSLAAVASPASTHTLDAFSWTQPAS